MLRRDADRARALFRQRRVINHQHHIITAHNGIGFLGQHAPQRRVVPGRTGDEVIQLIVSAKAEPSGDGLHALRPIWTQKTAQICTRYRRLQKTGKPQNVIVVAIAREMAAFVGDIACMAQPATCAV